MPRNHANLIMLCLCLLCAGRGCKKQPEPNQPALNLFNPAPPPLPTETLALGTESFTVELAFTRAARNRGLMFRPELPPNAGMLFVFDKTIPQNFYMKNCLIDLDLLYLDDTGQVTKIITMQKPVPGQPLLYYSSDVPVKYALELPAGTARRLNLAPGQKIPLPSRIRTIIVDPD